MHVSGFEGMFTNGLEKTNRQISPANDVLMVSFERLLDDAQQLISFFAMVAD